jgi:TolA-binding protein
VAPPISEFERRLQELDGEIKRLELEYMQFQTGRLAKLPWDSRKRVETLVKQYDRMHIQNTAERFRFQGLQARFSAFCELWERHLKSREFGRPGPRGRSDPSSGGAAPAAPRERPAATAEPATPGRPETVALRDPEAETEKVRALYEKLSEARRQAGDADVPFERFREVVRAQVSKHAKDGVEVAFRVGVQDGRVVFTAKPKTDATDE